MADVPITDSLSPSLVIPHVAQSSTWDTQIFIANPNNSLNSIEMTYYDKQGRVIRQTPYVNGRIHGVEKAFYPNGDRMITFNYLNGVKEGYAYSYYPNGKVCRKAKYKNNRIIN